MAVLLNLDKISKSFGTKALFTDLSLTVNDGDKIGIIVPQEDVLSVTEKTIRAYNFSNHVRPPTSIFSYYTRNSVAGS